MRREDLLLKVYGVREIWHTDVPAPGEKYIVLRETWDQDFTERHIYEVRLVEDIELEEEP